MNQSKRRSAAEESRSASVCRVSENVFSGELVLASGVTVYFGMEYIDEMNYRKWKDYWQVASCRAMVAPGKVTRLRLNSERGVEIDLTCPGKRTVAALWKGDVVGRAICPAGEGLTLIGGDRDQKSAWFIVVRRQAANHSENSAMQPKVLEVKK